MNESSTVSIPPVDILLRTVDSPLLRRAAELVSGKHLWKLKDALSENPDGGEASAYVLDGGREPVLARWIGRQGSCECGSTGDVLCVHLVALLVRLSETRISDTRFDSLRKDLGDLQKHKEGESEPGLFDWDLPVQSAATDRHSGESTSRSANRIPATDSPPPPRQEPDAILDPESDLLFFTEPNPVEKVSVLVLGPADVVKSAMDSRFPGLTGTSTAAEEIGESNFTDISGIRWALLPGHSPVREDGSKGAPRRWTPDGPPAEKLPVQPDIRTCLQELLESAAPPVDSGGRPWILHRGGSIRLRFDPLLSAADDDPLYEPVIELICSGEGEHTAGEVKVSGSIINTGSGILVMDPSEARAGFLDDVDDTLWFLRLMLSRKVLSASDLRARLSGKRSVPEWIQIDLPELPDTLERLIPVLVLEISGHEEGTDLIPAWNYGGVIIDGRGRGDVVMDYRGVRPRPVGLRDRPAEEDVLRAAENILGPALAWRRGRYSRLSGDPNIPLRLDSGLQDTLAEFGAPLMDAGVELRLENRPVRRDGSLNIRARKEGSTLEMTAGVKEGPVDGDSGEALDLELDQWLESGGLVRTEAAYFTFTGKALEQLNFLRDHGMEDSGFLSTSPDNLSLIDAVYTEIEASEETAADLEQRRSAYEKLTSAGQSSGNPASPPPSQFRAELRPYQTQGYSWLIHLREEGLGGCLADDMGLGKTVQTLAYLSRLEADGELGPSLLVGPVVTLSNWEAEIRRFAPELRFHRYAGPAGRRFIPGSEAGIPLIIVSYQTLRNDIEKFLDRDWDHVILDEAHYVKNAASRTFKAIRSLSASHRLSLTGTPMENHLDELWSQMSFLNPGLLGSRNRFNDRFIRPLDEEAAGESGAVSRLAEIVAPFILRRRKSEVLQELPPKDEAIIRCDMMPEQAAAYESTKDLYRRQVTGLLSKESTSGSRIEIFTILSKLRLLAIHPPLAGEPFAGIPSGKMAVMDNLLEEIMEEDHKTLVFSQFLGALDRAQETCTRQDWGYSRLTGSTKDRDEPIRSFSEDPDKRIFLLSLKAGGVGINLTAADYVVLLDPWWNPAVEAQAVDRAHRMGQQRPVMVYRLITTGTIEERVLELQERKKNLIAGVLGDGERPSLSDDEILNLFE